MTESIKVEISQDSVQQIIKAKVQAAVMDALLPHKEKLVEELVASSLCAKSNAEEYRYNRDKAPTVLEHMVRNIIAEEARKGIVAWAESHREEIAEKIRKQMATKKFSNMYAANVAEQMAKAHEYRFKLEITPVANQ